jgi:hypothetical protein
MKAQAIRPWILTVKPRSQSRMTSREVVLKKKFLSFSDIPLLIILTSLLYANLSTPTWAMV